MRKVLRIDTTWEVLTHEAWDVRRNEVYPYLTVAGLTLVPPLMKGTIASRAKVAPLAKDPNIVLITGAGHGKANEFLGDYNESLFPESVYDPREISGKIVHFLSCSTGAGLGPDFIQKGCRAFVGYNAPFEFDRSWADVFFRCDSQIDLALADGKSVSQAVQAAKERFDVEIRTSSASIAAELASRRDSLVALGANLELGI
jgi:hypothetical protein